MDSIVGNKIIQTLLCVVTAVAIIEEAAAASESAPTRRLAPDTNCTRRCGNVEIPYPFGLSPDCYLEEAFSIECNHTTHPPKPYIGEIEVTQINISSHMVHVMIITARICYRNNSETDDRDVIISLEGSSYTISDMNMFTAIGCNVIAKLYGTLNGQDYILGCLSYCSNISQVGDGKCSGVGCCQTQIPRGLTVSNFTVNKFLNGSEDWSFNPCGYALLTEKEKFSFSKTYLSEFKNETVPFEMAWSIGNETCEIAQKSPNYACKANSECHNSIDGSGYFCNCSIGYKGNPYLPQGCEDIDECSDPVLNKCSQLCINTKGSFNCSCFEDYSGDGRRDGEGCERLPLIVRDKLTAVKIIVAVVLSFMVTILGASWLFLLLKRRKLINLKEEYFRKNGGIVLQQQLSSQGSSQSFKIFSAEELKNATNNYHESTVIGKGGFGTVYKGVLPDNKTIAIKRSNTVDEGEIDQFINEVVVLSQINHRNVIKLLGCCLETKTPLLVYEVASNGTLFSYIHNEDKSVLIPWEIRLRIASETAGALSYLHFSVSTPIIHRDVKSTNILLDENYTAKVSDFGASKFIPTDQTQLETVVQGTLGYLDPEYLQTSQLTEKSDVYSFGVVLVELLTGLLPLSFNRSDEERCLAMMFLYCLKKDKLFEIVESHMVNEENIEQIKEVAVLAKRCLSIKGDKRPTMKEVAIELEGILMKSKEQHQPALNTEPTQVSMGSGGSAETFEYGDDGNSNQQDYDSMKHHSVGRINDGR